MNLECEVWFGILKGKALVEHGKRVVEIEKGMIVVVGKGIVWSVEERHDVPIKRRQKVRISKLK